MKAACTFDRRSSGVLLHVTSLPGSHGAGDLGPMAHGFVDQLADAGQTWWQMLPIGPPSPPPGNSPYSSYSIAAGSPWLISLEVLREDGLLEKSDFAKTPDFPQAKVDFVRTRAFREKLLRRAFENFQQGSAGERSGYKKFVTANASWLDDETLYAALKIEFDNAPWFTWPKPLRDRSESALAEARERLADEIRYQAFLQYQFDRQWRALRDHAKARGIWLIGDMPIFVDHDSVPVWCRPELWLLDKRKMPTVVSGTPPDAFSDTGQKWNHPLYDWPVHERENFAWWINRFEHLYSRFDAVRIDHFLGFVRLWSIPSTAKTALKGKWMPTPGEALLTTLGKERGRLPLIAEDLGLLTDEAIALRDKFSLPGMRILQFGFASASDGPYHRPHSYPPRSVAYTGTHDNDTTVGFLKLLKPPLRKRLLEYAGHCEESPHWALIRTVLRSNALTVITPMQDLLGLDSRARMNTPGNADGNWAWRMLPGAFDKAMIKRLRMLTALYDRLGPSATATF